MTLVMKITTIDIHFRCSAARESRHARARPTSPAKPTHLGMAKPLYVVEIAEFSLKRERKRWARARLSCSVYLYFVDFLLSSTEEEERLCGGKVESTVGKQRDNK